MKRSVVLLAFVAGTLGVVPATALQVPTALVVGSQSLRAASCATRDTLWIHHYVAALYVPPQLPADDALLDREQPKALLVQLLSRAFLPREMPKKWRVTLEQHLDPPSFASVREAWRRLAVGDRVLIDYAPERGVEVQLNEQVIARSERHEVVEALLGVWADGEPVRERVNRAVRKHRCPA